MNIEQLLFQISLVHHMAHIYENGMFQIKVDLYSSHMAMIWHWRENEIKMNKQKTQIWLLTFSLALSEFM